MFELLRGTALGHFLRIVTQQKVLPYPEERDPSLWKRHVDKEKSGNMAQHGTVDPTAGEVMRSEREKRRTAIQIAVPTRMCRDRTTSKGLRYQGGSRDSAQYNEVSGVKIDSKKGRNAAIVTWYSDSDSENPQNWSTGKKIFVTAMIYNSHAPQWIVPIIGPGFFTIGAFLLFNSVLNYLGDAYPNYAASVYAGNDFMRSSFGAGFPLFAAAMYNNLGVGWASLLLGFLLILFIPVPFVLYFYGERIRKASKRARHDI